MSRPLIILLFALSSPILAAGKDSRTPDRASLVETFAVTVPGTPAPFLSAMQGGFVVVDHEAVVTAYSDTNGSPLWNVQLETSTGTDPVAADGAIALLTLDATLIILSSNGGTELARYEMEPGETILNATGSGLFVAEPSGRIRLLDPSDGSTRWTAQLDSPASAGATLCGGFLLVGTSDGTLFGLDEYSGTTRVRTRMTGAVTTAAACNGRLAYVGSSDDNLHAIKVRPGSLKPKWKFRTGGDLIGTPIRFDGYLLFFSYDTYLYALKEKNGHLEWKVRLGRRPRAKNVMTGDILLTAPLHTESLEAFQLPAGTRAASFGLGESLARFVTAPSLSGDHIVIGAAGYGGEDSRIIGLRLHREPATGN